MNENTDVTIKILTEDMPQEFKYILYALLWTVSTLNFWMYIKIMKNIKELFSKRKKNYDNYNLIVEEINEHNE